LKILLLTNETSDCNLVETASYQQETELQTLLAEFPQIIAGAWTYAHTLDGYSTCVWEDQ
jgi:hypothetical protein